MRLLVTREVRLLRTRSGDFHAYDGTPVHPSNYLKVFDELLVLARVKDVPDETLSHFKVNAPGVTIVPLPYYQGPWQYLRVWRSLKRTAQQAVQMADAFMLRAPGAVATLLWHALRHARRPYGVEAVGDPWDIFAPGTLSSPLRPYLRHKFTRDLRAQCQHAAIVAYVTQHALQRRYPSRGWTTHYSSIQLPGDRIVDTSVASQRAARIHDKRTAGRPISIICVGTLAQRYKAPDILIRAVAQILREGILVEASYIGGGHLLPEFQRLAEKLGIAEHIHFRGVLPQEGVFEQLDAADVFVLPSRTEGLPRVVIEAMSRGLPCIATDVGGTSELLPADSLALPNDTRGLARRLREVLEEPVDQLVERIKQNIIRAHNYTLDILNARREQCYSQLKEMTDAQ